MNYRHKKQATTNIIFINGKVNLNIQQYKKNFKQGKKKSVRQRI